MIVKECPTLDKTYINNSTIKLISKFFIKKKFHFQSNFIFLNLTNSFFQQTFYKKFNKTTITQWHYQYQEGNADDALSLSLSIGTSSKVVGVTSSSGFGR